MAKKGKLTEKQQRFVDEYLIDLNATQAAIRAGYSVKTADAIGCENLTKPNIQQAIAEHMAERSRRTGVNQDRVVLELAKIAYKIETNSASEPWLWDVFSFVNGIIHVNEVKVSGSAKVNLINRVKIVSPTFTCSTAMKVTHEGNTYSLPAGETTVYDIRLQEGDNYVTFTGNGTVKISYRGGSL